MDSGDPFKELKEARSLTAAGDYAQALEKHLGFHKNATSPSAYGVRLSYALDNWAALSTLYPPARASLEGVRDAAMYQLINETQTRGVFQEIVAINRVLDQSGLSYDLFKRLALKDGHLAKNYFHIALPSIIEHGDFDLAKQFVDSPKEYLESVSDKLNSALGKHDEGSAGNKEAGEGCISPLPDYIVNLNIYIKRVNLLLAILDGCNEVTMAGNVRRWAVDSVAWNRLRPVVERKLALASPPNSTGS